MIANNRFFINLFKTAPEFTSTSFLILHPIFFIASFLCRAILRFINIIRRAFRLKRNRGGVVTLFIGRLAAACGQRESRSESSVFRRLHRILQISDFYYIVRDKCCQRPDKIKITGYIAGSSARSKQKVVGRE